MFIMCDNFYTAVAWNEVELDTVSNKLISFLDSAYFLL